jgi:hypothetical protein
MSRRSVHLLVATVLLPAAAFAQVEKTLNVPTRIASPEYAPETRAPHCHR